jgi:hypothetical protein
VNDKRQHIRYAIELDAKIETDAGSAEGRTHDLSKGGLCMMAKSSLPLGSACFVKIALVFSATEFSEQLNLPATIVWCTQVKTEYQIGLKFAQLTPQTRGYLDMFIKFLEGSREELDDDDNDNDDDADEAPETDDGD